MNAILRGLLLFSLVIPLITLLTGCGDSYVGKWKVISVSYLGQTAPVTKEQYITITKQGATYTIDGYDAQQHTGTVDSDGLSFMIDDANGIKAVGIIDPSNGDLRISYRLLKEEDNPVIQQYATHGAKMECARVKQ